MNSLPNAGSLSPYHYTISLYNAMDAERFGTLSTECRQWNISGGYRVQNMFRVIVGHIEKHKLEAINVLNMSGLLNGKPDPIIHDLLTARYPRLRITWTVVDHPQSDTIKDKLIRHWVDRRGITLRAQDFREPGAVEQGAADVVICTEILEHLDYSVAIRLLRNCRAALAPKGLLLLTTPNATFLLHRIMFAFGQWDFLHHMDMPQDVDLGLVGHIMYYDGKRLSRLLASLGFACLRCTTFNAGHGPGGYRTLLRRITAVALRVLSCLVPNAGQVLLVTAERGE